MLREHRPAVVTVDASLCRGHGRCLSVVPEAFDYDEVADQAIAKADEEIATVPLDRLRLAVTACPERAITLEEVR